MFETNYTNKNGNMFRYDGIICGYSVSSFTLLDDFNNGLQWYARHADSYKHLLVRIVTGIHGEPVYQILSLSNDSFDFYKNREERRKEAMGA